MGDSGAKASGDSFWHDEGQGTTTTADHIFRGFSDLDEFIVHVRQYGQDIGKAMSSVSSQIAPLVMDAIQLHLDRQSIHVDRALRRTWIKCLLHLNKYHGSLPPSIHLSNIVKEGSHPVAGGGFADIWKGRIANDNLVCLKVLRIYTGSFDEKKLMTQLGNEVLIWRQLRHSHIHQFLGVVNDLFRPSYCIISPWMANGDVMSYCQQHNSSLDAKVTLIQEICEGLRYLHEHSPPIVHSDIKGANILVSDDGHCRISDFGLCTIEDDSPAGRVSESTSQAAMRGSVPWLAPELMNPGCVETPNRTTSDIYALGCTIYELLSGYAPFADKKMELQIVLAVLDGMRPASPADCPSWLWKIIENCWSEEAGSRLTASEVTTLLAGRSLESYLASKEVPSNNVEKIEDLCGGPEGASSRSKQVDRKYQTYVQKIPLLSKLIRRMRNGPCEKSEEMSQAHSDTKNIRRRLLTMIRANRIRTVLSLVTITITIAIPLLSQPRSLYFKVARLVYDRIEQNEEPPSFPTDMDNLSSRALETMGHGDGFPRACSIVRNAEIGGIWLHDHSVSTSVAGLVFTALSLSIAFLFLPFILALLAKVGIELSSRKTRRVIRGASTRIGGDQSLQQEKKRHAFVEHGPPQSTPIPAGARKRSSSESPIRSPSPPQLSPPSYPSLSSPPVTIMGVTEVHLPSTLESMWVDTALRVVWRGFRERVGPSDPNCVYSSSRSTEPCPFHSALLSSKGVGRGT
ncbi:Homeobox protein tos8 [Marasmius tenuissimus]|nr:Homeobox protein tos8 [Marasmius tenuissimus]